MPTRLRCFGWDVIPQTQSAGADAPRIDAHVQSLSGLIDLIDRDTRLEQLLPHLADCLRRVADFDLRCVVLPGEDLKTAHLYAVQLASAGTAPAAAKVWTIALAPGDNEHLAAAAEGRITEFALDRLDTCRDFASLVTALRALENALAFGEYAQIELIAPIRTTVSTVGST